MERTLQLPDELARRLEGREAELPEILEAGLRAVERREALREEDDGDDSEELSPEWSSALALWLENRRASAPAAPSSEEIVAYAEGRFDPEDREAWLDRLVADRDSVRDLVDFVEFSRADAESDDTAETAEALRRFRASVARPLPEPKLEPEPKPMVTEPGPRRRDWVPWAAAFVLACGMIWLLTVSDRQGEPSEPRYATVLDIATSRGARPFPVSSADEVLLILPSEEQAGSAPERRLRITRVGGEVIYRDDYRAVEGERNRLYLVLPRDLLEPGEYILELATGSGAEGRSSARQYRFAIEDASER